VRRTGGTPAGTVIMLPDRTDEDGRPVFHDSAVGVVKTLQARGLPVRAATSGLGARYISEYGAGSDIVANIVLGVVGNLTYDALATMVTLVRLRLLNALGGAEHAVDTSRVDVTIDELDVSETGAVRMRGFHYSGACGALPETLRGIVAGNEEPGGQADA
jgi:uncharacterized membrane protein YeaQ/YmgE (transglycosylase-associated protein family)